MSILDPIYLLVALATWPIWRRRARADWPARFGHADRLPRPDRPRLLVHAVSVGEINALRTLVPILAEACDLVISATTDTGIARARDLYADRATIVRYPLDFSRSVRRFLDRVRPDAVALVELELWPNFIAECARRKIPVAVINGRLSARSFRGYRLLRPFLRRTFARLALCCAQNETYRARFCAMGTPSDRTRVEPSLKWDAPPTQVPHEQAQALADALGIDPARPLVVGASTAEGEEALLHEACPPGVQLLCAPRRPERFDEAARALPACVRRSSPDPRPDAERFLLDTIGELTLAYSLADVVVLGRSFGNLHGSDPLEPAALGKPILIGPAHDDFRDAVQALDEAEALRISTRERLDQDLRELLEDPARRTRMGEAARRCVESRRGVSRRVAEMLLALAHHEPRPSDSQHRVSPERVAEKPA